MSRNHPMQMSASNMSDIKQSIQEYSMNFQNNSQQAISQMISMSRTGHNVSMPKPSKNPAKKSMIKIVDKEQSKYQIKKTQENIIQNEQAKQNISLVKQNHNFNHEEVFLGDHVFRYIRERFKEVQGTQTADPDILFEFYKRQKKNYQPDKSRLKNITLNDAQALMPASQRKMLLRAEFQKILTYYPQDVYFTLVCGAQKYEKDQNLQKKRRYLDYQNAKKPQSKKKIKQQTIDRLYCGKKQQSPTKQKILKIDKSSNKQQIDLRQKRRIFGQRLQQIYCNQKNKSKIFTAQQLYRFWQQTYQRDQYGIQWDQNTAKQDIKMFMMEQVEDLVAFLEKKLGFKLLNQKQLKKKYIQFRPIPGLDIYVESFTQYLIAYNQKYNQNQVQSMKQLARKQLLKAKKDKQVQLKKFGRPVSATPLSVLAKPRTGNNLESLADKYKDDTFLSTLLQADKMKMARHPFQYGVYDIQEQIKLKGRIKPKKEQNFQDTIFKKLANCFANNSILDKKEDRVKQLLLQQDIQKKQTWKQLGPKLQEAIMVKCYDEVWLRDALLKYCQRTLKKDHKYSDDKTIVHDLFEYFNSLTEYNRKNQIINFENVINTSQEIEKRTKKILQLGKKGPQFEKKQRRLFYTFLQQKACQFMDLRIKRKQINLRNFLNEIFETSLKDHKQFVIKHFHVVTGDKQCPKSLKHEFFRLQKQINPITMKRDQKSKCHAWISTKSKPQRFNQKTFNAYSNAYKVDKNTILSKPEQECYKTSIWGHKKQRANQRQSLLMTFDDAKQCVFHPKISRQS